MKTIHTEIIIMASTERVWDTLMNHSQYPEWNPFITNIEGDALVGKQIDVRLQLPGKKAMNMNPKVLKNHKQVEFRWKGHLMVPGLFDGEHFFKLEAINKNTTRLVHGEQFTGALAGLIYKMVGESTKTGFIEMNEAMKKRVETHS